jgi:hypothetical protein
MEVVLGPTTRHIWDSLSRSDSGAVHFSHGLLTGLLTGLLPGAPPLSPPRGTSHPVVLLVVEVEVFVGVVVQLEKVEVGMKCEKGKVEKVKRYMEVLVVLVVMVLVVLVVVLVVMVLVVLVVVLVLVVDGEGRQGA